MQKVPFVFPIVGGRKVEHLLQNIEALDIFLYGTGESTVPFDLRVGFSSNLIVSLFSVSGRDFLIVNLFTRVRELHIQEG